MQTNQSQKEYLNECKRKLSELRGEDVTWDKFANMCGIKPRAFLTYRMPDESKDHREMSSIVRNAVDRVIKDTSK
jgi:hypothetical protein